MKLLRYKSIKSVLLLITGITFMNLSVFMAEVSLLNLSKEDASIECVFKILIAGGFEEESENPVDGHENSFTLKEVDLLLNFNLYHHHHLYLIAQQRYGSLNSSSPLSGYTTIFSPPPEA